MKKKPLNEIKFAIAQIKTEQFALLDKPKQGVQHNVQTELRFGADIVKHVLGVFTRFNFKQEDKQVLTLEISCHFQLQKSSWQKFQSAATIRIPAQFMRHLSIITVGCARGVLHAKTENTPFAGLVLPTVNLHKLVKEDLVIEVEG